MIHSWKNIRDDLEMQTPPPPPTYLLVVLLPARGVLIHSRSYLFTLTTLYPPLPFTHVTVTGHTGQRTYSDYTWNPLSVIAVLGGENERDDRNNNLRYTLKY